MSILVFPSGPQFPDVMGFFWTGRRIADTLEVKSFGGFTDLQSEFVRFGSNMKQQQTQYSVLLSRNKLMFAAWIRLLRLGPSLIAAIAEVVEVVSPTDIDRPCSFSLWRTDSKAFRRIFKDRKGNSLGLKMIAKGCQKNCQRFRIAKGLQGCQLVSNARKN